MRLSWTRLCTCGNCHGVGTTHSNSWTFRLFDLNRIWPIHARVLSLGLRFVEHCFGDEYRATAQISCFVGMDHSKRLAQSSPRRPVPIPLSGPMPALQSWQGCENIDTSKSSDPRFFGRKVFAAQTFPDSPRRPRAPAKKFIPNWQLHLVSHPPCLHEIYLHNAVSVKVPIARLAAESITYLL